MRPVVAPTLLLFLCAGLLACDRTPTGDIAAPAGSAATPAASDAARIEADVRALADDAMEGRQTATAGYDRAADYVAARYAEAGLAPGGDGGTYFQAVPLLRATLLADGARFEVRRDGQTIALAFQREFLPRASFHTADAAVQAPAVFVGQAVHAPELDHDDFAGLDLRGKIAVLFGGAPSSFPGTQRAFHASQREKLRHITERGAVGAVFVNTAADEVRMPWARAAGNWDTPTMRLRGPGGAPIDGWPQLQVIAAVSASAADALFAGGDQSAAMLFDAANRGALRGFDLPGTLSLAGRSAIAPVQSRNVVGRLPGSDPALVAEHVVLTAHLDHLGIGAAVKGDRIYNGAIDNALGVAIMLEAARTVRAATPAPLRSLLFVALTGEEQGLLGAEWFATYPTVARAGLVANINLDMPVLTAPSSDIVPIGVEHSSLKAVVTAAAAEIGVGVSADPFPEEVVFVRSDQYAFVRAGIPAVYLDGGVVSADGERDPKVALTYFLRNCYHQPCDDADQPIQYGDAARLARLAANIGTRVGNAPARPTWNAGDFFGGRFGGAAIASGPDARAAEATTPGAAGASVD